MVNRLPITDCRLSIVMVRIGFSPLEYLIDGRLLGAEPFNENSVNLCAFSVFLCVKRRKHRCTHLFRPCGREGAEEQNLIQFYSSLRTAILTATILISKRVIQVDQPESGMAGGSPVPKVHVPRCFEFESSCQVSSG